MIFKIVFEIQDDYKDNQGAEIVVSEISKEYKILFICWTPVKVQDDQLINSVRKHVLIFVWVCANR